MDKYFMWIHHERLHNHNKAKHNKTVCIFLGIYCMQRLRFDLLSFSWQLLAKRDLFCRILKIGFTGNETILCLPKMSEVTLKNMD